MRRKYNIDPRFKFKNVKDVIDEPIIIKVNSFTEESLEKFEKEIETACNTKQPVIPIVIDSYGG